MERRKNSNLHVVREPEDPTDKIIDEIMDELNSEDGMPEKEVREELMKRKKKKQKKMMVGTGFDTSTAAAPCSNAILQ